MGTRVITLILATTLLTAAPPVGFDVSAEVPSGTLPVSGERVVQKHLRENAAVSLPIAGYGFRRTLKQFGTWVDDGRFLGYHLGEDVEYADSGANDVPVAAIADGTVITATWANGYGGLVVIAHEIDGRKLNAIYGHLDDTAFAVKSGERVAKGQAIGILGDDHSHETDDRRKHLHFALYEPGEVAKYNGYTLEVEELNEWVDPEDFFRLQGALE